VKRASCRILKAFILALALLSLASLLLQDRAPRVNSLPLPLRRGMPHALGPDVGLPGILLTRSGQPVVPEPEEGRPRVLVLGGSSPFGYGTTRFRSYPGILQARLDDAGRPVEVVNGAFAAMDLLDSLEVLRQALPEMRPDLVVCALGINETLRLRLYSSENPNWSPRLESFRQALERFALYRFLVARVAETPRPDSVPPGIEPRIKPLGPEHIDLIRPVLKRNLAELVRLCRQAEVPLVLVLDPSNEMWPPFVAPDWSEGSPWLRAWEAYESGVRLLQEGRRDQALASLQQAIELDPRPFRTLPSIADLIREVAQESGVPVMEGMEGLRRASRSGLADENLFYDNCHLSPPGNRAFAGLLEAFLGPGGAASRARAGLRASGWRPGRPGEGGSAGRGQRPASDPSEPAHPSARLEVRSLPLDAGAVPAPPAPGDDPGGAGGPRPSGLQREEGRAGRRLVSQGLSGGSLPRGVVEEPGPCPAGLGPGPRGRPGVCRVPTSWRSGPPAGASGPVRGSPRRPASGRGSAPLRPLSLSRLPVGGDMGDPGRVLKVGPGSGKGPGHRGREEPSWITRLPASRAP